MIRAGALLVATIALSACSSAAPTEQLGGAAVAPGGTAIAKVVTRDRDITLLSGSGGVRATVLDSGGRFIARDVPIDALQNIDATSFEATHWSVAGANRAEPHPVPWNK